MPHGHCLCEIGAGFTRDLFLVNCDFCEQAPAVDFLQNTIAFAKNFWGAFSKRRDIALAKVALAVLRS